MLHKIYCSVGVCLQIIFVCLFANNVCLFVCLFADQDPGPCAPQDIVLVFDSRNGHCQDKPNSLSCRLQENTNAFLKQFVYQSLKLNKFNRAAGIAYSANGAGLRWRFSRLNSYLQEVIVNLEYKAETVGHADQGIKKATRDLFTETSSKKTKVAFTALFSKLSSEISV